MLEYTYAELLEKMEAIKRKYRYYKEKVYQLNPELALLIEQYRNEYSDEEQKDD